MNSTPGAPPAKKRPTPSETCRMCKLPHKADVLCVHAQQVAMKGLLEKIAVDMKPCQGCGEPLYFVEHLTTGARAPYTVAGLNHFIDCPVGMRFKRSEAR